MDRQRALCQRNCNAQATTFGRGRHLPPTPLSSLWPLLCSLVFQVLTLENWPDTMFKVQAVSGAAAAAGVAAR